MGKTRDTMAETADPRADRNFDEGQECTRRAWKSRAASAQVTKSSSEKKRDSLIDSGLHMSEGID